MSRWSRGSLIHRVATIKRHLVYSLGSGWNGLQQANNINWDASVYTIKVSVSDFGDKDGQREDGDQQWNVCTGHFDLKLSNSLSLYLNKAPLGYVPCNNGPLLSQIFTDYIIILVIVSLTKRRRVEEWVSNPINNSEGMFLWYNSGIESGWIKEGWSAQCKREVLVHTYIFQSYIYKNLLDLHEPDVVIVLMLMMMMIAGHLLLRPCLLFTHNVCKWMAGGSSCCCHGSR